MTNELRRRQVLFFCAAAVYAVLSIGVLEASRGYSTEWVFYSDNTHTEIVGEGYTECNWSFTLWWGVETEYYTSFDTVCGGGTGGGNYCPWGCPEGWICTTGGCTVPD